MRDLSRVRRVTSKLPPYDIVAGERRDHRPRALEEVRRRVDLGVLDVGRAADCAAAGHQDAAVRQQQRRRVVLAPVLERRRPRPRLGVRVPDLGGQHRLRRGRRRPSVSRRRSRAPSRRAAASCCGTPARAPSARSRARSGVGAFMSMHRGAAVRVVGERAAEVGVGPRAGLHDLVRPVHDGAVPVERARRRRSTTSTIPGRGCASSYRGRRR